VFGGTPNTARETHALPTRHSAFQKGRVNGGRNISDNPKYFGNISEKQPFSEIISDYFFGEGLPCQAHRADVSRHSRCATAEKKTVRTVKTVKSVFAHFSTEVYR
jgi:hypothetical protein